MTCLTDLHIMTCNALNQAKERSAQRSISVCVTCKMELLAKKMLKISLKQSPKCKIGHLNGPRGEIAWSREYPGECLPNLKFQILLSHLEPGTQSKFQSHKHQWLSHPWLTQKIIKRLHFKIFDSTSEPHFELVRQVYWASNAHPELLRSSRQCAFRAELLQQQQSQQQWQRVSVKALSGS